MEEDIKILKEYLDKKDRNYVSEKKHKFLTAIENILGRLEQLEEENKELKEAQKILQHIYTLAINEEQQNSIPKSVLKDHLCTECERNIEYLLEVYHD